jgi:hypothetical protein
MHFGVSMFRTDYSIPPVQLAQGHSRNAATYQQYSSDQSTCLPLATTMTKTIRPNGNSRIVEGSSTAETVTSAV